MLVEWIIGKWYLSVTCKACGVQFAFTPDDQPDETHYLTDSAEMVLTCPECYFPLPYNGHEIRKIQAIK